MTRGATIATSLIVGLGLAGPPAAPALAQSRVVVPIVIQGPRTTPPPAAPPSIQITTRTVSPQPGVTRTDVTVRDTTGTQGFARVGRSTLQPGETRVTVQDTTGVQGFSSRRPSALPPDTTVTHVTIQDTTGISGFASARPRTVPGATTPSQLPATGDDGSALVVPFPVALRPAIGGRPQSLTITTEGPIDAPIVILAP